MTQTPDEQRKADELKAELELRLEQYIRDIAPDLQFDSLILTIVCVEPKSPDHLHGYIIGGGKTLDPKEVYSQTAELILADGIERGFFSQHALVKLHAQLSGPCSMNAHSACGGSALVPCGCRCHDSTTPKVEA